MKVFNRHERMLTAGAAPIGELIDGLASPGDRLWPHDSWPRMRMDRPLGIGAKGGHGPIRYVVEAYEPGRMIRFRFTRPSGFDGSHAFDIVDGPDGERCLRHTLVMETGGWAGLSWPLIFRPLHDALIEDALDRAEAALGQTPRPAVWSGYVRVLRRLLARSRTRPRRAKPSPAP